MTKMQFLFRKTKQVLLQQQVKVDQEKNKKQKPKNKRPVGSTKTVGVGKMRPGRSSKDGDTKIKNKTFTYEK